MHQINLKLINFLFLFLLIRTRLDLKGNIFLGFLGFLGFILAY